MLKPAQMSMLFTFKTRPSSLLSLPEAQRPQNMKTKGLKIYRGYLKEHLNCV